MIIKASTIESLRSQFSRLYQQGLVGAQSQWKRVATRVPSGTAETTYGWLGKFPHMREWVGDRVLKSIAERAYVVENKKYEATIDVDRADIEDDNLGVYAPLFQSMGEEAENHIDRNIFARLPAGFTELCYDGQPYFDEEHPVNAEVDGSGADTLVSNIINPLVVDKPAWFLLDTSRVIKPLIYQDRVSPEFETITDPKQDTVFMKDAFLYGIRARRNFGFSFWQMAIACRDALTPENFEAAYVAMQSFKADGGDPLGLTPNLLVVSPANRSAGKAVVDVEYLADGASNPNYKAAELMVVPWLS